MRDENMLMYFLVFVLGFMVARMMGGRLVEGQIPCFDGCCRYVDTNTGAGKRATLIPGTEKSRNCDQCYRPGPYPGKVNSKCAYWLEHNEGLCPYPDERGTQYCESF